MTRVGWCPGGRPVADMLARYPGTSAGRLFYDTDDLLPAWTGPDLGPLGDSVLPHVSFKRWDLAAVSRWLDAMPAGRSLLLTYHHEPEQGTKKGDPPIEVWHARWAELVAGLAGHPRRPDVLLGPVYTRYWWQEHAGDMRWLLTLPGVDFHGWDVYNNGLTYRTPDDLLSIPRAIAARTGLPYLLPELGAVRLAGDGDGVGRSAWMRAMVAAARSDGALTACWYHKEAWDLTGPASAGEQQTWRELIQEVPVTIAPNNLKAVRALLLDKFGEHGLESDEVGIVGNLAHRGGYHCGRDRVLRADYSVTESSRDSAGLTDHASALDVGMFSLRVDGKAHDLRSFSVWCVAQCKAGAADTRDIREIIYSPDGKVVKRWDRLGKRTTGDSSHLTHTHFSFFRDSTKAGRDQTPLFRRYLTTIGLIEAPTTEDDMPTAEELSNSNWNWNTGSKSTPRPAWKVLTDTLAEVRSLRTAVTALAESRPDVDTAAVLARMDALAAEDAQRDADLADLVRQYQSGSLDAKAVADELAARLAS